MGQESSVVDVQYYFSLGNQLEVEQQKDLDVGLGPHLADNMNQVEVGMKWVVEDIPLYKFH